MDNVKLKPQEEFYNSVSDKVSRLQENIEKVIRGKSEVIQLCLVGLIARGHLLIEDIPGVGKSTLAHCIAQSLGLIYQRIQFTSDLLPSDILGLTIYDEKTQEFHLRRGPIFANIILADEINRSTPKTQSALLEAMNDAQITIDNDTHPLPNPFMVLATQNPIDHRGTFPLPESQLDRFMLRVKMGYPELEYEREILRAQGITSDPFANLKEVISLDELLEMQNSVDTVVLSEELEGYLLQIIQGTRKADLLAMGASTRGALHLSYATKARALILGRSYCLPDDIKILAAPVLSHRVIAEHRSVRGKRRTLDVEDIIAEIISRIPVPI